jgi:hypothetical protein
MGMAERDIERTEATREADRHRILNALVGASDAADAPPPAGHAAYTHANELVQGQLAAAGLLLVLSDGSTSDAAEAQRSRFFEAVRSGHVRKLTLSLEPVPAPRRAAAFERLVHAADPDVLHTLSLRGLGMLCELPPRLLDLTSLTTLSLRRLTALTTLPDELGTSLPNLATLDLEGATTLEAMPDSVAELLTLKNLLLGGCTALTRLPERLGGALAFAEAEALKPAVDDAEAPAGAPESAAGDDADGGADDDDEAADAAPPAGAPPADAPPSVPGMRLRRLDLRGCSSLLLLPDLSHIEQSVLDVQLDGCRDDLVMGWQRGMRKAFNVAFAR